MRPKWQWLKLQAWFQLSWNDKTLNKNFEKLLISKGYLVGMKRRNTTKEPNKILASSSDVCQNHHLWISRRFFFQLISVLYLFMKSFSSFLFNLVSRPLKIPEMKKCELPADVTLGLSFPCVRMIFKKTVCKQKTKKIITFVF
jgi:hypothetical protein